MTHYQFGTIVGDETAGDGVLSLERAILVDEHSTLATVLRSRDFPVLALQIAGRVQGGSGDTASAVFVMSYLDAGLIAKALYEAAERSSDTAMQDFRVGLAGGDTDG